MHPNRSLPIAAAATALAVALSGASVASAAPKNAPAKNAVARKDPIKIAYIGIESGPNATANRHNTIDLAVQQLNKRGGMDGHRIELKIYDGGQTAELALTAVKKALSENPSIITGLPVTAQVQAVAPLISPTRIPVIHVAQNPVLAKSKLGTNVVYRLNVSADRQSKALVKYAVETWKPKKVGLLNTSDTNSSYSGGVIEAGFEAAGVDVVRREVPFTATDLTEAVTAFKSAGVDVTVAWGFPNIGSLFLKQRAQNGLTVPHIMDTSGGTIAYGATNSDTELKNLHYVSQCDGDLQPGKLGAAFRRTYKVEYGKLDSASNNPSNYDLLHYLDAVVTKAKSIKPLDLNKTLQRGVVYTGVCGSFRANADNDLMTTMYIVRADGGAANKRIVATYRSL